jgi:DNA-binding LytR/AlgR family response regulator
LRTTTLKTNRRTQKTDQMPKISCLIVDDEPLALDILEKYIHSLPFLKLKGRCRSAFEAMDIIEFTSIDLLFLDIQMPELTGLELSRILGDDVKIVFTTAYSSYAVEGFKVNALDYLLKPFSYEQFLKSAIKVREWFDLKNSRRDSYNTEEEDSIIIKSDYKQVKISLDDVYYFEGQKDYVKIWLKRKSAPVMTMMSLKTLDEILPSSSFMRIHRSFIISLKMIKLVERNQVLLMNGIYITIAEPYKQKFRHFMSGISIS